MKHQGWLVAGMWMAASAVYGGIKEPLHVVVFDYVGLKTEDAVKAVELGRQFFGMVGVKTAWTVCRGREHCSLPSSGFVQVSVVGWVNGTVLGFNNAEAAAAGKPDVYVFHKRISALARKTESSLSLVLSCVMVHEMLHSLGLEHAPTGIMRTAVGNEELKSFERSPCLAPGQIRRVSSTVSRLHAAFDPPAFHQEQNQR